MRALAHGAGRGRRGGMLRRFDWLVVLVVGVVLFELIRRTLIQTQNPNFVPSLILLGAVVMPATFLTFVAGRRLSADVPGIPLVVTALLGGVIGTVVAGTLEYDTLQRLGAVPLLAVAVIEEAAKLVVPAALLLSFYRQKPANGLIIGVASGAGFAVLETMGYAMVALIESRGQLAAVDGTLLLRGLFSPAGHMAWTGLTAAALWHTAARGWSGRTVGTLVGTYVLAVVLHTLWDSLDSLIAYVVLAVIALGLLVAVTHRLARGGPGGCSMGGSAAAVAHNR
jgi:RsiW-degrading membrane proteinase PrsW (M82 family)